MYTLNLQKDKNKQLNLVSQLLIYDALNLIHI